MVWGHYVRLLVAPFELSADYSPPVIPILTVWTRAALTGAAIALALLVAALVCWRSEKLIPGRPSWRVVGLAVVWFVITISPVSNVLFLSGVLLAERTLYLPSVGLVAAAGAGLAAVVGWRRVPGWGAVVVVLGFFAARGWTRTPVWRSSDTVFASMVADHPESGRSQWLLGDLLYDRGRPREAWQAYARAVGALDGTYRLLTDVGRKAVEEGRLDLAERLLLRAWEERPEQARAPMWLAILYQRQGRPEEVERFARETLKSIPDDVASWHLLAGALTALGRWDEAIRARERVIELGEGAHWQQWLSLANLRLTAGDSVRAQAALDSALARAGDPDVRASVQEAYGPIPGPGGL